MLEVNKEIEELNHKLTLLKERSNHVNVEAKKWVKIRDSIHEQIKSLRVEATDLKEIRNELNDKVKELKSLREKSKTEIKGLDDKIFELENKMIVIMERKTDTKVNIQKIIDGIEWKIQTSRLTIKEEKKLIDKIRPFETQLLIQKRAIKLKDELNKLQTSRNALDFEAKVYHEQLSEFAEQSQESHMRMLRIFDRIDALQIEADNAHLKYVQTKKEGKNLQKEIVKHLQHTTVLKKMLYISEEEKQNQRRLKIGNELKEKALWKLNHGKKLTWEEFKTLVENKVL